MKTEKKETMNGVEMELDKYSKNISIYLTGKTDKKGNPSYGIAFYYDDLSGRRERKVFTGKDKETLIGRRTEFLTELYYEKAKQENLKASEAVCSGSLYRKIEIQNAPACNVTIGEAVERHLKLYKARVEYKTYKGVESTSKHIVKYLGKKKVNEITFDDFQKLVNHTAIGKDGKPVSEKLVKNVKNFFIQLMKYCRKQRWLTGEDVGCIIEDVKIPTMVTKYDKNSKFIKMNQLGKIFMGLKDNRRYYLVSRILVLTGMRGQEIFALKKEDLMRKEGMIKVCRALVEQDPNQRGGRHYEIGHTKTEESVRYVPAIPEVFEYLDEHEQFLINNGSRKKADKLGNGEFLFVDCNGNLIDKNQWCSNLKLYIDRHMSGCSMTLHMLRHCYITYLEKAGAADSDVDKSVGHVLTSVSDKSYRADSLAYIKRLMPYISQMAEDIEKTVKGKADLPEDMDTGSAE